MNARMKLISISLVVALCAVVGCKKKQSEPAPGSGTATAMAGSGSAMAGSGTADTAGSAGAAGSGDTGSAAGSADATGSAAGSGSAAATGPSAAVKLDELPAGWERSDEADGGKLETVVAVNDSKFPVDNAMFTFTFGPVTGDGAPTDPTKYGAWQAAQTKAKLDKAEAMGDAQYVTFSGPEKGEKSFRVVKKLGDQLWSCGGSLYQDADYNKIPKVRDEAVAAAKKLCASMNR